MRSSKHGLEGTPCFMPFAMRWWRRRRFCFCTTHHRLERWAASNAGARPNAGSTFGCVYGGGRKLGPGLLRNPVGPCAFSSVWSRGAVVASDGRHLTTSPCVRQTDRFSELSISPCQHCLRHFTKRSRESKRSYLKEGIANRKTQLNNQLKPKGHNHWRISKKKSGDKQTKASRGRMEKILGRYALYQMFYQT